MTMRGEENNKTRKIISQIMVSVDGFFEGPDGEIDWHNVDEEYMNMQAGCSIEQTLYYSVAGHISLWLTIGQPRLQSRTIQS